MKTIVHISRKKNTAYLEGWVLQTWLGQVTITGLIYNDLGNDFREAYNDGTPIRTAEFTDKFDNIFEKDQMVENTVCLYLLGNPKVKTP